MSDEQVRSAVAAKSEQKRQQILEREAADLALDTRRVAAMETQERRLAAGDTGDDKVMARQIADEQRGAAQFVRSSLPALKRAAKSGKDPDGNPLTPADVRELFQDAVAAQGIKDKALLADLQDSFETMVEPVLAEQEQKAAVAENEKMAKAREQVENAERKKRAQAEFQRRQMGIQPPGMKF